MRPDTNAVAYIDGANLHNGVRGLGWELDYRRLRRWLADKYGVTRAYLFLGLVEKYHDRYQRLQEAGYVLIFKEAVIDRNGKIKGNCDAELVLHAVRDVYENSYNNVVLVSSDGDYACLARFLQERGTLRAILSPSNSCSILLRRLNASLTYLDQVRNHLQRQNEKAPGTDGTVQGPLSS